MYIGGGAEAAKEMDGKSWIKFDLSALGADKELNQARRRLPGRQEPGDRVHLSSPAPRTWEKVGTETVDGVRTTHYKGTVTLADLEKSIGDEDKDTREKRQKSIEQYEKMGVDKLTMDMWIDGDDRTEQFRMRGDADKGPLDMTITFLGFNEPVKVTAPPARTRSTWPR